MTDTVDDKPAGGWTRGRILLVVSLALNLLFVGSMLGARFVHPPRDWRRDGPPEAVIDRMLSGLPEAKRTAVKTLLRDNRQQVATRIDALRAGREPLREALTAEPFDAARVRAVAAPLLKLRGDLEANKVELLIRVLQDLDAAERRQLLQSRFFRRLLGDKDRRHRHDGPPPPPPPPLPQ